MTSKKTSGNRLDTRQNVYRRDLADVKLRGKVTAGAYCEGKAYLVTRAVATLYDKPDARVAASSSLRFGEEVMVFEAKAGWAWIQNKTDGYVGYVRSDALSELKAGVKPYLPTHRVSALSTPLFENNGMKSPIKMMLSLNSAVSVTKLEKGYAKIKTPDGEGWIYADHIKRMNKFEADYTKTAERLVDVPYVWGGRTSVGIDCSGLVQLAANRAGVYSMRDTDQQAASLGDDAELDFDAEPLKRGDVLYMPGHVGIMTDGENFIHANATHMKVVIEPLKDVLARISQSNKDLSPKGDGILARRRINPLKPSAKLNNGCGKDAKTPQNLVPPVK